ncbi:MAG: protein phosphatase 2C domain-containing protein [Pseudomonadota bacterium]
MSADPPRLTSHGNTHAGKVRVRNEDALIINPAAGLYAVADGMGGEAAGDYASQTVVEALGDVEHPASADDLVNQTKARLRDAHKHLVAYAKRSSARVVGATVVVLLAHGAGVACLWSGDARCYRIRHGGIEQLSEDHNELGELVSRGILSKEEAKTWRGRNAVTRAVGVYDELETDMVVGDLWPGDAFVLCSDGLPLHVEDHEIAQIAHDFGPEEACERLIALALKRGGADNVSVIVVAAEAANEMVTRINPRRA